MSHAPRTRPSLLLRIRDVGDERAWREFVELYTPLIFGHCTRAGLGTADAADIAQDVMRIVARGAGEFDYDPGRGSFRGWLLAVTRNRLNRFLSRRYREPSAGGATTVVRRLDAVQAGEPFEPEESSWDREYHRRLFEWAAKEVQEEFEPRTWKAFWRTAVEQRSGQDVADELGMSAGAVYIARSRVLARLRLRVAEALKGFGLDGESLE